MAPGFADASMNLPDIEMDAHAHAVAHDSIAPLDEQLNALQKIYKPILGVGDHGCLPYAAVDADGNWSGGLKPSGPTRGDCGDADKGQVYVRSGWYNARHAVMYSWYFPKDEGEPKKWEMFRWEGQRHDWQNYIVWLTSDEPQDAEIVKICTSIGDKTWHCYDLAPSAILKDQATERLTACYVFQNNSAQRHRLSPWTGFGKCLDWDDSTTVDPPGIDWDSLSGPAQATFNADPFMPSAAVPFNKNFGDNIAAAWNAELFTFQPDAALVIGNATLASS